MGCYSVSCGVSRMPIYGEKAVLIPLIPNRFASIHDKHDGAQIVSNEGPRAMFDPLPPIFGEMNSYGSLENIEQDWHTEFLENYFKKDIETIAEMIARGSMYNDEPLIFDNVPLNVGMNISRPIWDYMMANSPEKSSSSLFDGSIVRGGIVEDMLKLVGFRFIREHDRSIGRYNREYVRDNTSVWTDGNYIGKIVVDGKINDNLNVYDCSDFVELFGCSSKEIEMFKNTKLSHFMMESVYKNYPTTSTDDDELSLYRIHVARMNQSIWTFDNAHILNVYAPMMSNKATRESFGDLIDMINGCWATSTVLMPSLSGLQHGDMKYMKGFYETALNFAKGMIYDD